MNYKNLLPPLMQYYEDRLGYCPDRSVWSESLQTIWYLTVNEFTEKEIRQELYRHHGSIIRIEDLSDDLWANSLTKKGIFYFHHALQLVSPAPVFSLTKGVSYTEDWCVPRIRFTVQDVTDYFVSQISKTETELWVLGHNMDREIHYILDRFEYSLSDIEPLDYMMYLLDELVRDQNKQHIKGLISVTDYIGNTLETYRNTILEAKARGFDQPRWPSCF